MRWVDAVRARLRLLFGRRSAEERMDHEFRFHLELEAERLMREEGLDAGEAQRRALVAFGGVDRHKETLREGRGLAWLGGLSLDFRLGFRMLVKHPGITVVGGLALAFAIWVGAVSFQLTTLVIHPTLPQPDGDRIVQLGNWDAAASQVEPRALHDFVVWRDALRTVRDIGAFRDATRNLVLADGNAQPVWVAEITASGFRIVPVAPLLGRMLVPADEEPGAAPVVVLGHEVWQTRFDGDPAVLGRDVQLGDVRATVIGVMPEGYAFPIAHDVWIPLRFSEATAAPRAGPGITIFARLADGSSIEQAQAELSALGLRTAADFPDTHEHLRPQVTPYAKLMLDPGDADLPVFMAIYFFAILLLVLISGNVALLMFARAATRETELVVRSALGASRSRIGVQLFVEALVLGGLSAAVGLAAAGLALDRLGLEFLSINLGRLPFWYDVSLSTATILYALGLTFLGAAIAGLLPAWKATRGLGPRLRQVSGGSGGLRFGGVWTAVIVGQVALTVAFPAVAYLEHRVLTGMRSYQPGFAAEQYVGVHLDMEQGTPAGEWEEEGGELERRFVAALEHLRERVEADPGMGAVTFVDRLPRMYHRERRVELDEGAGSTPGEGTLLSAPGGLDEVFIAAVDAAYLDVLRAPILAGRGFGPSDLEPHARTVIVDQGFVDQVLRGQNAVGRRVRFALQADADPTVAQEAHPWYEIVGVVPDLGMRHPAQTGDAAGLYLPTTPGSDGPVNMVVHTHGDPLVVAGRLRTMAAATDPALRLWDIQRLDGVTDDILWIIGLWLRITLVLTAIALLLSLAGIYAVLSFTVARRTREIGIRVALGANRTRLVASIFRRPLIQVTVGILAGGALVATGAHTLAGVFNVGESAAFTGAGFMLRLVFFVGYLLVMMGVCLLACIVPTRRALGVEPREALQAQ